jgi:preprotein translocase subunit SecE
MSWMQRFREFVKEVRVEFTKVTWLDRKQLQTNTAVVLITVLIVSFFVGIVDRILTAGLNLIFR